MQPVPISLVVGEKGSGVSTLLNTYRQRADTRNTLIVDGPARAWDTENIGAWLTGHQKSGRGSANSIVLAADDLRAPRHLLQVLAENADLAATYRLDSVTGTASSLTWPEAAGRVCAGSEGTVEREEARGSEIIADPQLRRLFATADRIILTHTDRARPEAVTKLAKALKALNPPAPILRAQGGDIGPARLVDGGLFDPVTGSIDIDRWLCQAASRGGRNLPESTNEVGVRFFAITLDQPLDATVLTVFLKLLMADHGADILRLKGIVATEDHPDRPALIDGREHLIQPLLWLPTWPTADRRGQLVFVTANTSENWVRTLLTTLSDQLKLQAMPQLQLAMVEKVG